MTITSKFSGKCKKCCGIYQAGQEIEWTKEGGSQHITCPDRQAQSAAPGADQAAKQSALLTTLSNALNAMQPLDALNEAVILLRMQQKRVDALYRTKPVYRQKGPAQCATRN